MNKIFIKLYHVINYKYLIYFIDLFLVHMYNQSIIPGFPLTINSLFISLTKLKFTTLEGILYNFRHFVIMLKTIQPGS